MLQHVLVATGGWRGNWIVSLLPLLRALKRNLAQEEMTMRAATFERNDAGLIPEPQAKIGCWTIDAAAFRDYFHRRPFVIGHPADRSSSAAVAAASGVGPRAACGPCRVQRRQHSDQRRSRTDAANRPIGRGDDSRIEECQSWMALKYVEHDPAYRDLLHECLGEVKEHSSNSRRA